MSIFSLVQINNNNVLLFLLGKGSWKVKNRNIGEVCKLQPKKHTVQNIRKTLLHKEYIPVYPPQHLHLPYMTEVDFMVESK